MDGLKSIQQLVAKWWTYAQGCLGPEIQAAPCRPFWTWLMIVLLGAGTLVLVWMAIKFISYRIKLAAALRAQAQRDALADEETMRAHVWTAPGHARRTGPP